MSNFLGGIMKINSNKNVNSIFSKENISKNILPFYNLNNATITLVKFKDTDKQRAVYKVDHNNKSYCLKKIYFSKEDLLYVYSAVEWLHRNGINVPNFIPSIDNNRFVEYNNMLFILTPWIEGFKCNFDDNKHLSMSIKELSKFHKVAKNFFPIDGSSNRVSLENIYLSNTKHLEQLLLCSNIACKYKDSFSKSFLSKFELNLELAKISTEISSGINNTTLTKSLCHGDFVNKNILIAPDNKIWIIDFDKCRYDYCSHDIAYFMRRLLKRQSTNWNLALTFRLLDEYNSISPLNESDLKYIVSYISFPQKYWKVSKDYYKSIPKSNKSSFVTLINKANLNIENHLNFSYNLVNELEKSNWQL